MLGNNIFLLLFWIKALKIIREGICCLMFVCLFVCFEEYFPRLNMVVLNDGDSYALVLCSLNSSVETHLKKISG